MAEELGLLVDPFWTLLSLPCLRGQLPHASQLPLPFPVSSDACTSRITIPQMQSHFSVSSEDLSTLFLTFPQNGSASLVPQGPQETLVVLEDPN